MSNRSNEGLSDRALQQCCILEKAFSPSECAQLVQIFSNLDSAVGGLVAGQFDQNIRQSSLVWLPENEDYAWIEQRLARLVADVNRQQFGFALDGFEEQVQLAAYGPGHYYDWHIDQGQGRVAARRKLTLSVQLSPSDDYEDGALEINADGRPFQAPRSQGTLVAFASNRLHRVEPVTSGLRHSLVAWVHGPAFT